MNLTQRALAERSGRWAENWAAFVLQLKCYAILGRRVQTPAGEIDLMIVIKWRWPKHVRDAGRPDVDPTLSGRGQSDNVISFRARRT